jgi:hypothetical protein
MVVGALVALALVIWLGWTTFISIVLGAVAVVAVLAGIGFGVGAMGASDKGRRNGFRVGAGICVLLGVTAWHFIPSKTETTANNSAKPMAAVERRSMVEESPEDRKSTGSVPEMSAQRPTPSRMPLEQLKMAMAGTFRTADAAATDLSVSFLFPRYTLNESRTHIWANGNEGTWNLFAEHPLLTAEANRSGMHVLAMTAPGEPSIPIPMIVSFSYKSDGTLATIRFSNFMGIQFPPNKAMVLYRVQ